MLGDKVRNRRKEMGLTLVELCKISNLGRTTIYEIENNRSNPSMETIEKLSKALDISVSELLEEEPNDKITEYQNQNKLFFSKFGKLSENDRNKIIKMIEIFEEETQD